MWNGYYNIRSRNSVRSDGCIKSECLALVQEVEIGGSAPEIDSSQACLVALMIGLKEAQRAVFVV
jgi:hypothetical protein